MRNSSKIIGFLQSLGLLAYIGFFALCVRTLSPIFEARFPKPDPILPIMLVLLTFVTSALICSSIALGYPVYLYLHGEKEKPVHIVLWNIAWLVTVFALCAIGLAAFN